MVFKIQKYKKKKATFETFESKFNNDKYVRITHSMMDSVAWNSISIYAHEVYMLMKYKYAKNDLKGTSNKDDISLTYKEIKGKINSRTFTKALDELIDYGFIKIVFLGRFSRTANIYGFNDMWRFYGTDKFSIVSRPVRTDKGVKTKPKLELVK